MALGTKVLCPTLDIMLKKTILALCEVNIKYDYKLEICGSLHIRSDDQKVLTCLIDEQILGQCKGGNNILGLDGQKKNGIAVQPMKLAESEAVDLSYGERFGETQQNSPSPDYEKKSYNEESSVSIEGNDMIEVMSLSSHYSKSPGAVSTENQQAERALDLSNTSESEMGQPDSEAKSPRVHQEYLPPHMIEPGMPGMVDAQASAVTQQIAALNQMAEMMHRNIGMVLPAQPPNPDGLPMLSQPLLLPPGGNGQVTHHEPNNNQPAAVKVEPHSGGSPSTPSSQVTQASKFPATVHSMMVNPMQTAMMAASMALDPLTIGNPVHTKTGVKKWQCVFCGILVSSKFYLSSHINAVHTRTRIYPCELCGKLFYSHGAQRIHKLRNHWVEKRHKCPQCGQLFVLPFEMRQHISRKHRPNNA